MNITPLSLLSKFSATNKIQQNKAQNSINFGCRQCEQDRFECSARRKPLTEAEIKERAFSRISDEDRATALITGEEALIPGYCENSKNGKPIYLLSDAERAELLHKNPDEAFFAY